MTSTGLCTSVIGRGGDIGGCNDGDVVSLRSQHAARVTSRPAERRVGTRLAGRARRDACLPLPACQPASPGRPPSRRPEAPAFPSVCGITRAKTRASSRSLAAALKGLFDAGANAALYDDAFQIIDDVSLCV